MTKKHYGPKLPLSEEIHAMKYRLEGESFYEAMTRVADSLKDSLDHFQEFRDILLNMKFLPGGRVQSAMGSPRTVTAFNCFVSGTIGDSMNSIMSRASESAETQRLGGGIGYNFSTLRPRGDLITSLDSRSSGPIPFMGIFNAVCDTIASAGHRRGAQMGVLNIDHPDIEEFVRAKNNDDKLNQFNISIGVTDKFMEHLREKKPFPLTFKGKVYKYVDPEALWNEVMRSNWDWAEPGILFIDRINKQNNLWYCETIEATNPCGEQPLPPYGACLLGSFNLTSYVYDGVLDLNAFVRDIPAVVRAMDNIIDRTTYPLKEQGEEARNKRRMGLGITGLANVAEACKFPYGSKEFLEFEELVLRVLRNEVYKASVQLAKEKGSFPLFDAEKYLQGSFIKTLPQEIKDGIREHGIRNSHLLSLAPTGTISLTANNVSASIEPPFTLEYERTIQTFEGPRVERVRDFAYNEWGIKGRTANEISVNDHVRVLATAQKYIDSAVSKTCNVGSDVTFEEFSDTYTRAYALGCKGITLFRADGKRFGILNELPEKEPEEEVGGACTIDLETGIRSCE